MSHASVRRPVARLDLDGALVRRRPDTLVTEEPLEIRVGGRPLAVTMRTPGYDLELATGFLLTEGLVAAPADIARAIVCSTGAPGSPEAAGNVVEVTLAPGVAPPPPAAARAFYTASSCGICGKASIDAVRTRSRFAVAVADDPLRVSPRLLAELPDRLRAAQRLFETTGGLHAAALVDPVSGELLCVREDVGRHNAVDKVIGACAVARGLPLGKILLVSGRASFELVQKALMAGVPMLAAVSAPSSLAVDLASESGMTLVGFLRGSTMNVYAGGHRLGLGDDGGLGPVGPEPVSSALVNSER